MSYKDDEEVVAHSGEIEEEELDLPGDSKEESILDDDALDDVVDEDEEEAEFAGLDGSSED